MPNIANVLKEEIQRLAKKQVKAGIEPLRRENTRLRKHVADLRRQIAELTRTSQQLLARAGSSSAPAGSNDETADTAPKLRPTSKSLESLRHRLGLTQVQFGQLLGVSGQAVVYWAARRGPVKMRRSTLAALADVQRIGKREARKRLEAIGEPPAGRRGGVRTRARGTRTGRSARVGRGTRGGKATRSAPAAEA